MWQRTRQRPPTQDELDGLIEDFIKEEVLYCESMAMGLDRDDTIIRRRLRQKMEFFTDDLLAAVEPTDEALRAYLGENPSKFRVEAKVTFEHIYFNRDRRGSAAEADAVRDDHVLQIDERSRQQRDHRNDHQDHQEDESSAPVRST